MKVRDTDRNPTHETAEKNTNEGVQKAVSTFDNRQHNIDKIRELLEPVRQKIISNGNDWIAGTREFKSSEIRRANLEQGTDATKKRSRSRSIYVYVMGLNALKSESGNETPQIVLRISEHPDTPGKDKDNGIRKTLPMDDVLKWASDGKSGLWNEIGRIKRNRLLANKNLVLDIDPEKVEEKSDAGLEMIKEAVREIIRKRKS